MQVSTEGSATTTDAMIQQIRTKRPLLEPFKLSKRVIQTNGLQPSHHKYLY